jgi:hypothetical protein
MSYETGAVNRAKNLGSLLDLATACETTQDAARMLSEYRQENKHASENIGYMLGYLGAEERARLYRLFEGCNHPIFGPGFGRGHDPTPEEAFEAGKSFCAEHGL